RPGPLQGGRPARAGPGAGWPRGAVRTAAGTHRGRPLVGPKGPGLRPTADRVRESLFNLLGQFFEGGEVLDLYAGTGALAFEALSRGMSRAVLVDPGAEPARLGGGTAPALGRGGGGGRGRCPGAGGRGGARRWPWRIRGPRSGWCRGWGGGGGREGSWGRGGRWRWSTGAGSWRRRRWPGCRGWTPAGSATRW